MISALLSLNPEMVAAARWPYAGRRDAVSGAQFGILLGCGVVAALALGFIRLGLRIPGNAIVLAVLPTALGLSLVPRRLGGSVVSAGAFTTAALLSLAGVTGYGGGAFASLCLIGPVMDAAVAKTRAGWRLYAGLVLAGMVTNAISFLCRGAGKWLGLDTALTARPFALWWPQALLTYAACGAIAGLIGAACWFHLRASNGPSTGAQQPLSARGDRAPFCPQAERRP